jgi:hypothetical protein
MSIILPLLHLSSITPNYYYYFPPTTPPPRFSFLPFSHFFVQAGGGIGFTVEHTRNATEEHLQSLLKSRLDRMIKFGTTLAEAKSGYGLDFDTEVKHIEPQIQESL